MGEARKRYCYNCVGAQDLQELFHICDNHITITRRTFLKHVDQEDLRELEKGLGYNRLFHMTSDWHVSYHRSRYRGKWIYFFQHSSIEYVFH